jgi:tetratricopeptide (TPR) repeat protein
VKKSLFLILFSVIVFNITISDAFSSVESRRKELISVINEELKEVTRLNKRTKSKNPNLMLRMAELLLEKARLIKEQENARFLRLNPKERKKINKKKFFSKSRSYFKQAQKTGVYMLKRYKRFSGKGDVYYILAYNAKEFGQHNKARQFFEKATKNAKKKSPTSYRSKLALAEIYYNQSEYRKAIPLYQQALPYLKGKDKWYTKDSYNLSWSYFRVGKTNAAIKKMKEVYKLSKNPRYIDMSFSIERDLAYFYTDSGRTKEAVKFYKKRGKKISANLVKVGKYLVNQGKFAAAGKVFVEALKYKTSESEEIEIHSRLLSLYERSGQTYKHLTSAKKVYSYYTAGKLNPTQKEQLIYHAQRMSALLQKQVTSKRYQSRKKIVRRKAKAAVSYFEMLAVLTPKVAHKSYFFAGETYYASGSFNKAVAMYDKANLAAKKVRDKKYEKRSFDGMMASLAGKGITKATNQKYLIKVYLNYIKKSPRDKKANKIFQRLFSEYYTKKEIANCEKTLIAYKRNFPNEKRTQEAMLARIMDYYKNKSDKNAIKKWVSRINSGEFVVSKKYAKKVRVLLLTMQFENVEKASSKGDKKRALKGYVEIYRDQDTDKAAKKNAAYNIAVLFHELGDFKRAYGWTKRALSHMKGSDVKKFQSSYLAIASDFFNRQKFNESAEVYELVFDKICKQRTSNKKIFFKNAVVINLANDNFEAAESVTKKALRCNVSGKHIDDANFDLLKYYGEKRYWDKFANQITMLERNPAFRPRLIADKGRLVEAYRNSGRTSLVNSLNSSIIKNYDEGKRKGRSFPLESLDVIAKIKIASLKSKISSLESIKLRFPEKSYNSILKKKFAKLDQVTAAALKLLETGSGFGIVTGYKVMIQAYEGLANEVRSFVPEGKSKDYVTSFQTSMKQVTQPLLNRASQFRSEALKQIRSSSILAKDNVWFNNNSKVDFDIQFQSLQNGVIMDRGGRR